MKLTFTKILIVFICFFTIKTNAADMIESKIISENVLLLKFRDGTITYYNQLGQDHEDDISQLAPLNVSSAENPSNYSITSTDDSNYSTTQNPIQIGRFTKGVEFSGAAGFPINYDHELYLMLPQALQQGATYTITVNNVLTANESIDLTFDVHMSHSPAVHVNQIGYLPNAGMKYGYVGQYMGSAEGLELDSYTNTPFHLINMSGNIVFSGTMTERIDSQTGDRNAYGQEFNGADVWECDFSTFSDTGTYRLVIEGIGCSHPFEIKEDAYNDIFYDVSRSLFHQRCGVELEAQHTDFPRPLCHHPSMPQYAPVYSTAHNQDGGSFNELIAGATSIPMPNAYRKYHDAADWDSRASHLNICFYLNTLYELNPDAFTDDQMRLPESGNGIPDILDESKFGMDTYRGLIGPTGGICGGIEEEGHPLFGDASYLDDMQWYVYAEEPKATYQTAGVLAQYTYILSSLLNEQDSVAAFTAEAENLYTWASNNMLPGDESAVFEVKILAASLLFRLTGKSFYHDEYKSLYDSFSDNITWPENSFHLHSAIFHYYKNNAKDVTYADDGLNNLLAWVAFTSSNPARSRAFRFANNPYRPMKYGAASTPFIYQLIYAYELTDEQEYLDLAGTTLDHFLGNNMTNMCWITGHGQKSPQQVMHLDSWVDGNPEPIPGYSVYGTWYMPNNFGWHTFNGHGYTSVYPPAEDLPMQSAYMENRYSPGTAEFTVHETNATWIFALGYFLPAVELLPTGLSEFEAEAAACQVELNWTADTEFNTDYFVVERSNDAINFAPIGRVNANGNSTQVINYQFIDNPINYKDYYYRLKTIDKDGTYEYSNIVIHKNTCEVDEISIFPNPTSNVAIVSRIPENADIQVINSTGKIIQSAEVFTSSLNVDLSHFPAGIYFIKIQTKDNNYIHFEKIIKTNN